MFYCVCCYSVKTGKRTSDRDVGKLNSMAKGMAAAFLADVLIAITTMVVGILGTMGVIDISPAAAYSLVGTSCFISLTWILLLMLSKDARKEMKDIFKIILS